MRVKTAALLAATVVLGHASGRADDWDGWDEDPATVHNEMVPGFDQVHEALPNDQDFYVVYERPASSYEVLVDGPTSILVFNSGPGALHRTAVDGTTILTSGDSGESLASPGTRSLRWQNATTTSQKELVRFRTPPAPCGSICGTYRIRYFVTTVAIPRFNNTGSQTTIVILQNSSALPADATLWFWNAAGGLAGQSSVTLPPNGSAAVNSSSIALGVSGSVTISHTAPYGSLAAKAVALEPTTGFTFDTPGVYRPQ
jgi:hypothetical protein